MRIREELLEAKERGDVASREEEAVVVDEMPYGTEEGRGRDHRRAKLNNRRL
jgi:predicted nucleic acid-binding OB-fold protein